MAKKSVKRDRRMPVMRPHAAGMDIGAEEIYVAIPSDHDDEPVRCFGTFTCDLRALADWLQQCGIDTVATESTGVSDLGIEGVRGLSCKRPLLEKCARAQE